MTAIYLVLDMTNEFIHPEGAVGSGPLGEQVRARDVIANTMRAIAKARLAGIKIGFVRVGYSPDYREAPTASTIVTPVRSAGMLKLGTWATAVHEALAPQPQDFDIVKHRVSAFYGTSLEPILRAHRIEKIYFSGVSSVAVVNSTVRDAHDRDFTCTIIEDACAAPTPAEQDAAMLVLRRFADIVFSHDVTFL
jgi:nicotinamidase-related amidase